MPLTDADARAALRDHAKQLDRYRQGDITDAEFRPRRLGYGLYYEREDTSYMQRIKLPGGLVTAAQAEEIAAIADDYARGRIHVTTRQNVQLHWVELANVMPMYERLHAVGITTRGAAGDCIRNVTGCVHAGFQADELFDMTPYVHAAHEHFLFHPLNLALPRKFKIAFSSCAADCAQARINDVGYFPHLRDGKPGFSVYAAGGLGPQPFLAPLIRQFIPAEDMLIMTEAILQLWNGRGERKNRKRARMKYLFQRLGAARFIAEIDQLYARIDATQGAALRAEVKDIVAGFRTGPPGRPPSPLPPSQDATFSHWARTNVFAQKQEGYYGATVKLAMGEITSSQLCGVAALVREFGSGDLRATVDQNLMLPWTPGEQLPELYRRLCQLQLAEADVLRISDITCCPGADYCSLAMSRSMAVADAIRSRLLAGNGQVEDLGVFRIKISGCPNSCGQHHTGDIGLTGMSVKAKGQAQGHYSILLGGRGGEATAAIGKRVRGRFPEAEVPAVVAALAEHYRHQRLTGEPFADFALRVGADHLGDVARAAAAVVR